MQTMIRLENPDTRLPYFHLGPFGSMDAELWLEENGFRRQDEAHGLLQGRVKMAFPGCQIHGVSQIRATVVEIVPPGLLEFIGTACVSI